MYRTKVILKSVSKRTNLGNLVVEATFISKEKRERVYISTNEKVISHQFLGSKISKSNPNHKQIWERVEEVHGAVRQVLFEIESDYGFCTAELFKQRYYEEKQEVVEDDLMTLFSQFIELKRLTIKPKLVQKLQAIEKHLKEFLRKKRKVYPSDFDQLMVNKLAQYWRDNKGFQPNTIAKNFKFIRQFLNHLFNEEILKNSKYQRFQYPREVETNTIVLTKEEVVKLIQYIPRTHSQSKVRDLFLVLIYTGLRFGDGVRIRKSWVKGEFLYINTQKTGEKVSIPIHPHLKEVLAKYEYDLGPLKISNQKFNDYVKGLCKEAGITDPIEIVRYEKGVKKYLTFPKHQLIASHTGRRTFITNAILAGIPLPVIQKITGHRKLITLQKYVEIADENKKSELEKLSNFFQ